MPRCKITKKVATVKTGAQGLGIVLITTGITLIQQGDYVTGAFLVILGLCVLYAQQFIRPKG
ncbi:MAG: hypothetical protein J7J91_06720 [Deltaproteobacteria bacterium]|nr:hypothetical protein [Deltaproteobacteria bacterium]